MKITQEMIINDIEQLSKVTTQSYKEGFYLETLKMLLTLYPSTPANEAPKYFTVADVFHHYCGTKEYEGIVATIQKWFYGSLVKAPWCATSMCWALAQLGLRAKTIGGKYENVYELWLAFETASIKGTCKKLSSDEKAKYGDIVILNFSDFWSRSSKKHVTAFEEYVNDEVFIGIGGNQSDSISACKYNVINIVDIYRPFYESGTLKLLEGLPNG